MGEAGPKIQSQIIPLLRTTFSEFQRHKAAWLAAAIAYFTVFAIAPLIIVVVEIVGLFLGSHQAVLNQLYGYLGSSAGPAASEGIKGIVTTTFGEHRAGIIAQIIGWVVFVFAAIGLFAALQDALNTIWDVTPKKSGIGGLIRQRLLSFGIVLAIGFLLLVSLMLNTVLTVAGKSLANFLPLFPTLLKGVDLVVTLAAITVLFALIFKFLPERAIAWRDVWVGAVATAALFTVGQFVLGWYLGRAGVSSGFGAFGGLIVFLLWVNYCAQILLFGAQFTNVYARSRARGTVVTRGETEQRTFSDKEHSCTSISS